MYTLQAGQIENALRGGGADVSAKEMVQAMCNCAQPLEHRGSLANTKIPNDNSFHFPSFPPSEPSPNFYFPAPQNIINIPPWQNIPFTPIPYPDYPEWRPIPYPDWPGPSEPVQDIGVVLVGPVTSGPVTTSTVNTTNVNSTNITNEGDLVNNNSFVNNGPVTHNGPVIHNHRVVNNRNVVNKKQVINQGPVFNRNIVHNAVAHNYYTYNHGDTHHYGDTYSQGIYTSGPNEFAGDTYLAGGDVTVSGDTFDVQNTTINLGDTDTTAVTIEGDSITLLGDVYLPDPGNPGGPPLGPIAGLQVNIVVDVEWDGTALKKKYRTFKLLGSQAAEQTATIVSGTSCPTTPLSAAASNLVDMP